MKPALLIALWLMLPAIGSVVRASDWPQVIEVFVLADQINAVQGMHAAADAGSNVYLHKVDAVHQWERERSRALQAAQREALASSGQESFTHEQATDTAAQLVGTFSDEERQLLVEGWQTLRRASVLGIEKTPAIVFNQQQVLYGVTDLDVAIRLWQVSRE